MMYFNILSLLLKIFSNKYTYIFLFILTVIISSVIFVNKINSYEDKIEELEANIENLNITNSLLIKENIFHQDKIKILLSYSNSSYAIEQINIIELSKENKNAINYISNDFYNYFTQLSN